MISLGLTPRSKGLRNLLPTSGMVAIYSALPSQVGAFMLAGILFVAAMHGTWSDMPMFYFSSAIASLLFFSGLIRWRKRH